MNEEKAPIIIQNDNLLMNHDDGIDMIQSMSWTTVSQAPVPFLKPTVASSSYVLYPKQKSANDREMFLWYVFFVSLDDLEEWPMGKQKQIRTVAADQSSKFLVTTLLQFDRA